MTMKPTHRLLVLASAALLALPAAAQTLAPVTDGPATAPLAQTGHAVSLAAVDQALLAALRAPDQATRQAALKRARRALGRLPATTGPSQGAAGRGADGREAPAWLARTDQRLDGYQARTRRALRDTLIQSIRVSPYGAIKARDLRTLRHISDALRMLRELRRLGGGDPQALTALQSTYWNWLQAYGRRQHFGYTAIGETQSAPVFGQRVLVDKAGRVQIYQLTGRDDHTVRWVRVATPAVPKNLLRGQALTVDLNRERAPWLLVVSGNQLDDWVAANPRWLAAIQGQVRLVVRVRGHYTKALAALPEPLFAQAQRRPYVLPAPSQAGAGRIHLIDVTHQRVLGHWPLRPADQSGIKALKALINRIVAAGGVS